MAAQQAEFVAFKADVAASTATVAASIKRLDDVVTKSNADAAAAATLIAELQSSYSAISIQAAPWSAAIQAEVGADSARTVEASESSVAAAEAAVAQAQSAVDLAIANLSAANAALSGVLAGARPEEIAMYQYLVNQAQSEFLLAENIHFVEYIDILKVVCRLCVSLKVCSQLFHWVACSDCVPGHF